MEERDLVETFFQTFLSHGIRTFYLGTRDSQVTRIEEAFLRINYTPFKEFLKCSGCVRPIDFSLFKNVCLKIVIDEKILSFRSFFAEEIPRSHFDVCFKLELFEKFTEKKLSLEELSSAIREKLGEASRATDNCSQRSPSSC